MLSAYEFKANVSSHAGKEEGCALWKIWQLNINRKDYLSIIILLYPNDNSVYVCNITPWGGGGGSNRLPV